MQKYSGADMDGDPQQSARCVREAILNLLELIGEVAADQSANDLISLRDEARETLHGLIAAIITADGKYDASEQVFFDLLIGASTKPGGDLAFLRENAERWRTMPPHVPRFFQAALSHDASHGTDTARAMMLEIQLAGNNACVSDGRFSTRERDVIQNYLTFLDAHLET